MVGRERGARVELALGGFAGDERGAVAAALERGFAGVETQLPLLLIFAVAFDTVEFQQRFDLLGEVHGISSARERNRRDDDNSEMG